MQNALYPTSSFSYAAFMWYSFSYFRKACGVECN